MILGILLTTVVGAIFGFLQSTLFFGIIPLGIVPDLAMIFLAATAWRYGSLTGEISGFLIGLSFDITSLSPLGFHAFLFTLIGFLFGRMKGSIAPGPIMIPVLAAGIAAFIKYLGFFLLSLLFSLESVGFRYFILKAVFETMANMVLAPLIFLLAGFLIKLLAGKRGGFH